MSHMEISIISQSFHAYIHVTLQETRKKKKNDFCTFDHLKHVDHSSIKTIAHVLNGALSRYTQIQ